MDGPGEFKGVEWRKLEPLRFGKITFQVFFWKFDYAKEGVSMLLGI